MPPAARITDNHACPVHGGGPIVTGDYSVLIGYMPAARASDTLICPGPFDQVRKGEKTVIIGHLQAARLGDPTDVGVILQGCPTVLIGSDNVCDCLKSAAETGSPFVTQAGR